MKFNEYKNQVKRTCPDLGIYRDNPVILNSLHMSVGMFGEIYELNSAIDKINLAEEITDILWYACNYANIRNIEVPEDYQVNTRVYGNRPNMAILQIMDQAQGNLINAISEIQDYDKKEFAYNKQYGEDVQNRRKLLIYIVFECLSDLYALNELNAEQAMENNINKLKARYPDKFDEEKAVNRNLEAERTELEK